MLFKYIFADGNDFDSTVTLQPLGEVAGAPELKLPLWFLCTPLSKLPHYHGFTDGQHFEIDVTAVKVKHHADDVTTIEDGKDLLPPPPAQAEAAPAPR